MLSFIPTPIGHRDDITVRALQLLQTLPYLLCEDTRTTQKLLSMYEISLRDKQLISFHGHTTPRQGEVIKNLILTHDVGVMSEAGTPGLSDPGKQLIQRCHELKIPFTILPGATALIPAVVAAGFPTHEFSFRGFLPPKKGRQTILKQIMTQVRPVFIYESVHRIQKLLDELQALEFVGTLSISREISKHFEQHWTGDLTAAQALVSSGQMPLKGEFVIGIFNQNH